MGKAWGKEKAWNRKEEEKSRFERGREDLIRIGR